MTRERGEPQCTLSAVPPSAENHVEIQADDTAAPRTASPSTDPAAGLSTKAHALPGRRYTTSLRTQIVSEKETLGESHPSTPLSCTPTRCRRCESASGPLRRASVVAPFSGFSHFTRISEASSLCNTLAGTRPVRRKTDYSPARQGESESPCYAGFFQSATHNHVKRHAAAAHIGQSAQAGCREVNRCRGTSQSVRCFKAGSPPPPQWAAINNLLQTPRAATTDFSQINQAHAQQHVLRKEGSLVKASDMAARQTTGKQSAQDSLTSTIRLSRLTGRTGSLPPILSMRKSLSTAALLSSRRKPNGATGGLIVGCLTDPATYSRLPPEVWVYKGPDCSPLDSLNAKSEEYAHKRSTLESHGDSAVSHSRSRASSEAGLPVSQSKRNSAHPGKRLVFPLENPDGHQQADYLCSCIPALLELNNVPTLFSLKHSLATVDPGVSIFPQQASGARRCSHGVDDPVTPPPAEGPAAPNSNLQVTDKGRGSGSVSLPQASPAIRRQANTATDVLSEETSSTHGIPPSDLLSTGLQAAHDARVLSEWWGGLMKVVDVTLFELCRQLKTFAPFHAKCLEFLHQQLVEYAELHQQIQAKQVAQLHTALLEAHAGHATLRREIASLEHKRERLQSKAQEAGELRRMLDIHAHLFSLQEIEVLSARQVEEDALRADFQWHKLLEVVEAIKYGKESASLTEVWASKCSEERRDLERTEQPHQFFSAVLPTVVTLLPHETIVKGTLDSSVHVRLFQIRIPPGRWNLAVAVTCSQSLDISLLLLLASKCIVHKETQEQENFSEQEVMPPGKGNLEKSSPNDSRTFRPTLHEAPRSSVLQIPSSVTTSAPSHTVSLTGRNEASHSTEEATNVPDSPMGSLQIGSFASFRIDPGEPQILHVKMPAAGSPNGGWLLMRVQGACCTKSYLVHKSLEARRNSLVSSARSSVRQGTAPGPHTPFEPLKSPLLESLTIAERENQSLQVIGTADKLLHVRQGGDMGICPNKVERSHKSKTELLLGGGETPDRKREKSLSLGHDSVFSAAALGVKEVRFSLTVHSVFLHRSVGKREKHASPDASEHAVRVHTNTPQLQCTDVRDEDSSSGMIREEFASFMASAHTSSVARSEVSRPQCSCLRGPYSLPARLVLRREANTQTVTSKLLRGYLRRLHEGRRPPPVPQFCVCKPETLNLHLAEPEKNSLDERDSRNHTSAAGAVGTAFCSQTDLELTAAYAGARSNQRNAVTQTAAGDASPSQKLGGKPLVSRTGSRDVELRDAPRDRAYDDRKHPCYYPPSYPILKLLLDETPVALGDFTALLRQRHILRNAVGVSSAFEGTNFVRWPPRLLAETVWTILLQHARTRARTRDRDPAEQQAELLPTCLRTERSSDSSPGLCAAPVSLENASASAQTHVMSAALPANNASKRNVPCLSMCCGAPSTNDSSVHSSAAKIEHTHNCFRTSCDSDAHSLAAFTFNYFLSRLDVALLAHSVLHSFLLSILYWAPLLEAIAQPPPEPDGIVSLHRPLLFSGSITTEKGTKGTKIGSNSDINEDVEGEKQSVETVRDQEVKRATAKARGFTPWFAVRLFARITGLLSSPRDTQLFRRSLNSFVCLVVQALLDELTLVRSSETQRGRSSFRALIADEHKTGSASCNPALSRLPCDRTVPRHRSFVVLQSLCGPDSLSLPFIPTSHLQVPNELCLAVTHRAAARIGVRIFSEEGTSEYRAVVLKAISLSKETALASLRLPRRLSRWTHEDPVRSSLAAEHEVPHRRTCRGRTSSLHSAVRTENISLNGERSKVFFRGPEVVSLNTCGPPDNNEPPPYLKGLHTTDTSWDLPIPVDLLMQILTQQWEVLYVHLQQAMELVLDETDEKLLKPLTSLRSFSAFIRRLNPRGTSTPQEVLRLYHDTLSATSSRLQPFCSSLPSSALSALLLHRSCLLDFPLPIPPSPFLTLAPYCDVTETSAVPRHKCSSARPDVKRKALPLWPIHNRSGTPLTTATSNNSSQTPVETPAVGPSSVVALGDPATQIISSASYEFRLAAFIVDGLAAFMRAEAEIHDEGTSEQRGQCPAKSVSAYIPWPAAASKAETFATGATALSSRKGVQQKLVAGEPPARSGAEDEDSMLNFSLKEGVRRTASLRNMRSPGSVLRSCLRKESATDVRSAGCGSKNVETQQRLQQEQGSHQQAGSGSCSQMGDPWVTGVFGSECGGQRRVRQHGVQGGAQQATLLGASASTAQAGLAEAAHTQRWPTQNFQLRPTFTTMEGTSPSVAFGHCRSPSNIAVNQTSTHHESCRGTKRDVLFNTPASVHTRWLSSSASVACIDIALDRRAALETATDIEVAAGTERGLQSVPAAALLERLQFFLKGLLVVFGRTDLPDVSTNEMLAEPQEDLSALRLHADVVRSLEGFTPSRGRLSPEGQRDEERKQTLNSSDVATAQVLLQSIWNSIFKVSARIAEEHERRTTFVHLFALQRIQCRAAAKEALGELARIYRDQVDRLLILSLGSEGVSAIVEQPELREQLLQMHQSVADLEQQQLRLQQVFASAGSAATAGEAQRSDERSGKPLRSPSGTVLDDEVGDVTDGKKHEQICGKEKTWKSYSGPPGEIKRGDIAEGFVQRQNKSTV